MCLTTCIALPIKNCRTIHAVTEDEHAECKDQVDLLESLQSPSGSIPIKKVVLQSCLAKPSHEDAVCIRVSLKDQGT